MMKYKVVLATLSGCTSCQGLKDLLSQNNINFTDVPCDKDPGLCDQLEAMTKSNKYPIAIIKDLTQNLDYVYFQSFDYNEIGKETNIDHKVKTIGYFSAQDIITKIKSI